MNSISISNYYSWIFE